MRPIRQSGQITGLSSRRPGGRRRGYRGWVKNENSEYGKLKWTTRLKTRKKDGNLTAVKSRPGPSITQLTGVAASLSERRLGPGERRKERQITRGLNGEGRHAGPFAKAAVPRLALLTAWDVGCAGRRRKFGASIKKKGEETSCPHQLLDKEGGTTSLAGTRKQGGASCSKKKKNRKKEKGRNIWVTNDRGTLPPDREWHPSRLTPDKQLF